MFLFPLIRVHVNGDIKTVDDKCDIRVHVNCGIKTVCFSCDTRSH